jgi:hypothetical protein
LETNGQTALQIKEKKRKENGTATKLKEVLSSSVCGLHEGANATKELMT